MFGKVHNYKGNRISPSQLIMMVLLMERPMYGYELLKLLRDKYEGIWEPQTGAVYPALRRLQDHGLLSVENLEGKDHYSLSEEGRRWLEETMSTVPSGVHFMFRTIEIIESVLANLPARDVRFTPPDMDTPEVQLRNLQEVRDMMRNNLRMIDAHISELERELKE